MRRLRTIENEVKRHEADLDECWLALAAEAADTESFAREWRGRARGWSFAQVNELIDRHNRNFPAEARLPMDPRTRDFVKINGRSYERKRLDEQWILERWPADLSAARRAA
jgi:hypothetical protein